MDGYFEHRLVISWETMFTEGELVTKVAEQILLLWRNLEGAFSKRL